MRHASGLEDQIHRPGNENLLTYLDADLSLKHVGVLVLVAVGVHRRSKGPWSYRVLDKREVILSLVSFDHKPDAKLPQPHRLALIRRKHNARPRVRPLVHGFGHQ